MDTGSIRATEDEALQFRASGRPGKLSIAPTKPLTTQRDLSLAYSPRRLRLSAHPPPLAPVSLLYPPNRAPSPRLLLNRCRVINRARDKC